MYLALPADTVKPDVVEDKSQLVRAETTDDVKDSWEEEEADVKEAWDASSEEEEEPDADDAHSEKGERCDGESL